MGYIQSGKKEGATVVCGGERIGEKGYYIQPTIFSDVKADMKIVQEEIFGPVATVVKFETEEEALKLANDTTYGLATCVYTQNINRAINFSNNAESGSVYVCLTVSCVVGLCCLIVQVNAAAFPDIQHPFGGTKQSGFGRDLGEDAIEGCVQVSYLANVRF